MKALAVLVAATATAVLAAPAHAADLKPVLRITTVTAPIRVDVPYTITVSPAARAKGKRARIQVKGIRAWTSVDTFRIPKSGKITDDVEGYQPGIGRYRVLVLGKNGKILAKSNTATVVWTPRDAVVQ